MLTLRPEFCVLVAILTQAYAQLLPNSQTLIVNELEHLYFDNAGPQGFKSGLVPCTNYLDSTTGLNNNSRGRETAAQWIRTAFHDFITADVAAGTGGLDASIGFETLRPENVGVGFNDSLFYFSFFMTDKASMADLMAMGVAMAIGTCGGPQIPYRGGRIDATKAGPSSVCEPETDLRTTLSIFSGAGFNQADTIALTACGHTMGGVHHSAFPQIVGPETVSANNLDGRHAFDDTVATYDINNVRQYLSGTGNRGGALVTTTNKTVQSDLRLFESDNNKTVEKLAQSPQRFNSICSNLIARMIDTVPSEVILTSVLDPGNVKHVDITLNVDWSGELTLAGFFRYIEAAGANSAPDSLDVTVIDRNGHLTANTVKAVGNLTIDTGNGIFGPTFPYPFTVNITGESGLGGLAVFGERFPLQDTLFVVLALSSINPGLASFNILDHAKVWTFNVTAAYLTNTPPPSLAATIAYRVPQPGNMSPRIDKSTKTQLDLIGKAGPFSLYSVVLQHTLDGAQVYSSSIDIVDEGSGTKAEFFKLFRILLRFCAVVGYGEYCKAVG